MQKVTIKELANYIKTIKENDLPMPIFFLGAGASKTGEMPLASEIVKEILDKYAFKSSIAKLDKDEQTYANLMECLLPAERNALLEDYIKKAKVNVTHMYLAQLLANDYVDYILTTNFDDLMLKALAIINRFPPTYDIASLNEINTTTAIYKGSVVYLHGQKYSFWKLNTKDEMEKVNEIIPRIFDSIKDRRPWIFIGYSGTDPIIDHVINLGRFDNGLYWVAYKDNEPNDKVRDFLNKSSDSTFIIKGYDADSFMLKLSNELVVKSPEIIDKPFSALKNMLEEIVDIQDVEHYKGVKERLEISKKQVNEAIQKYEEGEVNSSPEDDKENKIDILKRKIIEFIASENYDEKEINKIVREANIAKDKEVNKYLSGLFNNWGVDLFNLSKKEESVKAKELYKEVINKYKKAVEIDQDCYSVYYNWGNNLSDLAKKSEGKESERLYREAFKKYEKAVEIKPDYYSAYHNWGIGLGDLAKRKEGEKSEELYREALKKYEKAVEIKPDHYSIYNNWGIGLVELAKRKEGKESDELYREAFKKYEKAVEIKPDYYLAYYNWGNNLSDLAKSKERVESEKLYIEAFKKYDKAIEIKPDFYEAHHNWGTILAILAKDKEGVDADILFKEAIKKHYKAIELGASYYNLACTYAIKGDLKKALILLDICLIKGVTDINTVLKDDDWNSLKDSKEFKDLIEKYS